MHGRHLRDVPRLGRDPARRPGRSLPRPVARRRRRSAPARRHPRRTKVALSIPSHATCGACLARPVPAARLQSSAVIKVGTWNVNGIRARQAQLQDWIEREQPHIVCLQEIKASQDQIPVWLCELEGYWCYWHGTKGYSGVGLHVSKALAPERPAFDHPAFDYENRIVTADVNGMTFASIYVPNGGKDYPAKVRFLESLKGYTADLRQAGRTAVLCGDLNIAR